MGQGPPVEWEPWALVASWTHLPLGPATASQQQVSGGVELSQASSPVSSWCWHFLQVSDVVAPSRPCPSLGPPPHQGPVWLSWALAQGSPLSVTTWAPGLSQGGSHNGLDSKGLFVSGTAVQCREATGGAGSSLMPPPQLLPPGLAGRVATVGSLWSPHSHLVGGPGVPCLVIKV